MSHDIVVLSEKLRRPQPRGLSRERLIRPIVSADSPPTALVVALAGAGKTTLLAQVAARLPQPVAWYRATAGDSSAAALVAHLAASLGSIDELETRAVTDVDELLAALDGGSTPLSIVIDDLHEIRGTEAESTLDRFLQLRPTHLRVVMGSRTPPQFNLPRLRVSGQIVEIGHEDLRFRSWEVEQLLLDVYGQPLPPESSAALARKLGGWAAGLQLFHLATSNKSASERRRAVAELDGRSHSIRAYLASNVLSELSDEKRLFLTRTCTLGVMTPALCDAILGIARSGEILAELEESQLFTSSDDGLSYRYHQVLQEYLESALLAELGPSLARMAYGRSAALLEQAGAAHDALRAYARAEDWTAVARMMGQPANGLPHAAEGWEELIPSDLRNNDPWFALADARRLFRRGEVDAAVGMYRHAAALLNDPGFQDRCHEERRLAAAWAAQPSQSGRSEHNADWHWSLRVRDALRRSVPAESLANRSRSEAADWLADGLCSLVAGDLATASGFLLTAAQETDSTSIEKAAALLGLAIVDIFAAGAAVAEVRLEEARQVAEVARLDWVGMVAARIHEVLRRQVDHDRKANIVVLQTGVTPGTTWASGLDDLIVGISLAWSGQSGVTQLRRAATTFEALDAPVLQAWALSALALSEAWRGGLNASEAVTSAEGVVRRSGAAGPQALLAVAFARNAQGPRAEYLIDHAVSLAGRCGFAPMALLRLSTDKGIASPEDDKAPESEQPPQGAVVVRCLGGFAITVGSRQLDVSSLRPRARALLHLLAIAPDRDLHREALAEALWPGMPLASATRSLQVSVSSVRQAFELAGLSGTETIVRRGDAYRLALPVGHVDHRDLEAGLIHAASASSRGEVENAIRLRQQALDLYVDELLPEDGPAEWVVGERERLRVLASRGAIEQARDHRTRGDLPAAIRIAQRALQIDRFSDEAWDLLEHLHDEAGNQAEALRARHDHSKVVAELFSDDDANRDPVSGRRRVPPRRDEERALA